MVQLLSEAPVTDMRYIVFKILALQIKIFPMQREYQYIDRNCID